MALDLAGIANVGEFYSQHYLDSLFAGDVKNTLKAWAQNEKDGGDKAPPKRLASLANRFFEAKAEASEAREPAGRLAPAQALHAHLLEALGYARRPQLVELDEGAMLPVLLTHHEGGQPYLWVVEAPFAPSDDDAEPLDEAPLPEQVPAAHQSEELELAEGSWRELFDGALFRGEAPPRWVLLLAGADVFLVDRHKWAQGKYLHFDLGALLGRRDAKAMQATAALLHAEVLLPGKGGSSLLDTLNEHSHKQPTRSRRI